MSYVCDVDPLARFSLVYTNGCDTNRPSCVTDAKQDVRISRLYILAGLAVADDCEDVG